MDENDGGMQGEDENETGQRVEEIVSIIQEARKPEEGLKIGDHFLGGSMDLDDLDADGDMDDIETSGDFVCEL